MRLHGREKGVGGGGVGFLVCWSVYIETSSCLQHNLWPSIILKRLQWAPRPKVRNEFAVVATLSRTLSGSLLATCLCTVGSLRAIAKCLIIAGTLLSVSHSLSLSLILSTRVNSRFKRALVIVMSLNAQCIVIHISSNGEGEHTYRNSPEVSSEVEQVVACQNDNYIILSRQLICSANLYTSLHCSTLQFK